MSIDSDGSFEQELNQNYKNSKLPILSQLGVARQKLDIDGKALKIQKKLEAKAQSKSRKIAANGDSPVKYQESRNQVGVEKSLK